MTSLLLDFAVALAISSVTSLGGISGAFLILPFQISVLGLTGPAVTPTNHLYNVVATPAGILRFVREGRMLWPLAALIVAGTAPGVIAGSLIRIHLLPDPRHFKLFAGAVLILIGSRLLNRLLPRRAPPDAPADPSGQRIRVLRFDWQRLEYEFLGQRHGASVPALAAVTATIGVIGGAYGIGGAAIISPLLVALWRLPVHTIAAAALFGNLATSLVGVLFFACYGALTGIPDVTPDWPRGLAFGLGGLIGVYLGARVQRRVPARPIEAMLGLIVTGLGLSYAIGFLWR
ncbi:MAG: sulfite exporter TauE/SafE family protein [Deltaproteobacteria bacterium]|nr:sulfite exporter TauE/SafE family protein [Deltaproteobacteria bacterium]